MSQQRLTIETTLKLDGKLITDAITRNISVDFACPTTVTVPKDAPGCKKCFRVEAGLKELLKFFLLQPKVMLKEDEQKELDKKNEGKPEENKITAQDYLKKGFSFYTSDPLGHTAMDPAIELTDTQVFTDSQIALLFGEKQEELEKITFINHTGYQVDVTIIQGRDLTPCDEDDAACAYTPPATVK